MAWSTLDGTPYVWVELAWNTNILSWKTGSINWGIKAWTNLGVIPVYGARLGFDQDLNLKQVLGDIDPHSLKTLNIGGNVTMIGALPSWGLSAWFSNDQLKGIEKQYNKLNKMIWKLVTNALKEIGEETDINKQKEIVNRFLSKEYKNADKESLAQATENIVAAIRQTLEAGIKPEEAANVIAHNWNPVTLGNRIYRMETAALVAIVLTLYEIENDID